MSAPLSEEQKEKAQGAIDAFKLSMAQDKAMDVLVSDATYIALGGGSRSGKTFLLVRAVIIRALKCKNSRHIIFRFRHNAIKKSVVLETLPEVIRKCFPDLQNSLAKDFHVQDLYWTLPNGSEIWFSGLDDSQRVENVLGKEYATIYFNECSQIPWQSMEMALTRLAQKTESLKLKAYYDFNPPSKKHWTYVQFVEKKNFETKKPLADPMDYGFYLINPYDNKENLDPKYLKLLEGLSEKKRKRFLLGKFADDDEGALWTDELLAVCRVLGQEGTLPDWLRIIIAVDPSGCRGEEDFRSDEIGIVVVALGADGLAYLLEDLSGRYKPEQWGRIVADTFERYEADRVIGEMNYGGDMVRSVIHGADSTIPYSEVHASRGKVVRAEPISALYEQGHVKHVGYFPEIEEQLTAMTTSGYDGIKSPDRADAVIWALTELFPKLTKKVKDDNWIPPQVKTQGRSSSRHDSAIKSNRSSSRFDRH